MARKKSEDTSAETSGFTQRDLDYLSLETQDVMKKYKVGKQSVYDKRYALKKRLAASGLTLDQAQAQISDSAAPAPAPAPVEKKKTGGKRGRPKSSGKSKPGPKKAAAPVEEVVPEAKPKPTVAAEQPSPSIKKPIEINFENFSVKLNGVPKKISVNPDTNAVEIDL